MECCYSSNCKKCFASCWCCHDWLGSTCSHRLGGIGFQEIDWFHPHNFQQEHLAVALLPADDKGKFDEVVEDKGVRILIDPKAVIHAIGTKMDFVDDTLKSEFVFINPNSKGQCGCGPVVNPL